MLNVLRHKGFSRKILWAVSAIIILSFGLFGTAYRMDNVLNSAGKIYGQSVSLQDFQHAYLDGRDQAIIKYGDQFFKSGQSLDLEGEAWSRLILLREARIRHIMATDKDVVALIASLPFFQQDGKFNQSLYENIVRSNGIFDRTPKDFEAGIRKQLTIRKLLESIAGNTAVTDEELKTEYVRHNEKIKLSYAVFPPSAFDKGLTASDEEIRKFYEEHKETFRHPPMIAAQYIHLLYPDKATEAQKKEVKERASAIARELTPEADMGAIATKYKTQVKDSSFFTQEQPLLTFAWSPEFVDKLFTLKTGQNSGAVEAPDGWQIVRIKERQESAIGELNAITDKVKEALLAQKALAAAQAKAEENLKTVREQIGTKDFKTIAGSLGLSTEETDFFSRGQYINAPGLTAEFQQESMRLNDANKLSGIVATSQGPVILYLSGVQPIDEKQFGQDKEDFRQMITAQKNNQVIATFVNKLKLEANLQSDLKNKIRYR